MATTKLRISARGQECQIRVPGVCNGDPQTTVLCHLPGAGMGRKHDDMFGAFGCSACHDAVDGRLKTGYDRATLRIYHLEGVIRTQWVWLEHGMVTHP